MFTSLLLLVSAVARAAPDCEAPSRATDVLNATQQVSIAWATKDGRALREQHATAMRALECVPTRLDPTIVSQVHLAEGLFAFYGRDYTSSEQAFAGVIAIDSGYQLPDVLGAPPPLIQRLDMARDLASLYVPIDATGYVVLVDGTPATERPANRGAVVQVQRLDEQVLWTRYIRAGESLPEIPSLTSPPTVSTATPAAVDDSTERVRGGLGVGVDLGFPASLRLENRPRNGALRAIGGRVMFGVATDLSTMYPLVGAQLYVDLGIARTTSIELGPFLSTTMEDRPIGVGLAVRQELGPVVHVQIGAMIGAYWDVRLVPDAHVGFVW